MGVADHREIDACVLYQNVGILIQDPIQFICSIDRGESALGPSLRGCDVGFQSRRITSRAKDRSSGCRAPAIHLVSVVPIPYDPPQERILGFWQFAEALEAMQYTKFVP